MTVLRNWRRDLDLACAVLDLRALYEALFYRAFEVACQSQGECYEDDLSHGDATLHATPNAVRVVSRTLYDVLGVKVGAHVSPWITTRLRLRPLDGV